MWGHVFWDKTGGINYFVCDSPSTRRRPRTQAVATGDTTLYAKAAQTYSATGCYMNLSYNKDWVVAQKWLTGVPEAQNIGANELELHHARHREVGRADRRPGVRPPPRARIRDRIGSERTIDAGPKTTDDRPAVALATGIYDTIREGIIRGDYPQG